MTLFPGMTDKARIGHQKKKTRKKEKKGGISSSFNNNNQSVRPSIHFSFPPHLPISLFVWGLLFISTFACTFFDGGALSPRPFFLKKILNFIII